MKFRKEELMDHSLTMLLVLASCLLMGFNLNGFVNSAGLYPGGFNGITVLVQRIARTYAGINIPFSVINYPLNFILIALSFKLLGKRFTFYTCITILLTGIFADVFPVIELTNEPLLSCVFGGMINGASIGLVLLAKASGGGTDIIGIMISHKFNRDPWNYVFLGNVVMLVIAGFLFGWDQAFYSIIFQFTSTQVMQMMYQKYQRHTLFIVTDKPKEVYEAISAITNHGATVLDGTGCYKNEERSMVYSVISSMEVKPVIKATKEIDPHAFINAVKTDRLDGHFYNK